MSLKVAIKKRFKDFQLNVAFESNGAPLGILGASGSGKSMTLRCIAGIETPDEGYIELNGRVLFSSAQKINVKPQRRRIGYLFQSYALFPHMTVEKNIACALAGPREQQKAQVEALLQRYQLAGLGQRYPSQLSGGQQQRVALARILAYQPEVLLLDEPFSALDAYLKEALQLEMMELLGGYEGDAVMVTHNRDEVYKLSENLLVLEDGQVAALGHTRQMFERPGRLAVARLTGCKNYSRARRLANGRVEALDWGCELTVAADLPSALSHIGVRAHAFAPTEDAGAVNAIAVKVHREVESPFEWNLLFYGAKGEGKTEIWWMVPKAAGARPEKVPAFLTVAPEHVLLLEA